MPNPTPFALWQDSMRLTRAVDAAKVLGVTREAVRLLRAGKRAPSGPMRQLMRAIAKRPKLASELATERSRELS